MDSKFHEVVEMLTSARLMKLMLNRDQRGEWDQSGKEEQQYGVGKSRE